MMHTLSRVTNEEGVFMEPLAVVYIGGGVVTLIVILIILYLLFGRGLAIT